MLMRKHASVSQLEQTMMLIAALITELLVYVKQKRFVKKRSVYINIS